MFHVSIFWGTVTVFTKCCIKDASPSISFFDGSHKWTDMSLGEWWNCTCAHQITPLQACWHKLIQISVELVWWSEGTRVWIASSDNPIGKPRSRNCTSSDPSYPMRWCRHVGMFSLVCIRGILAPMWLGVLAWYVAPGLMLAYAMLKNTRLGTLYFG